MTKKTPLQLCIEVLEAEAKKKVSEQFGTGADNARYGGVSETGNTSRHNFPCHAYMNGMLQLQGKDRPIVVYSAFVHPAASHKLEYQTKRFFDWITWLDSPWFPVFTGCSVDTFKYMEYHAFQTGFIFDNLDTVPANYLHNFLVASRMPKEWPSLIRMWSEFVDHAVDPAVALFFSSVFQPRRKSNVGKYGLVEYENTDHFYMSPTNHYDWPLDHATCAENYVLNLIRGKVDDAVLCPPWAKADRYTPVNRIWGRNDLPLFDLETYLFDLFNRYNQKTSITEVEAKTMGSNLGSFNWMSNWFMTKEEVFTIVKAENQRLLKAV